MFYNLPDTCQIKVLDFLYDEFFGPRRTGFFVEIGAYDGESFSNTSALADLGWSGVYVEPVPDYAARCRARHRDNQVTVLNFAVSGTPGPMNLLLAEGDTTAYPRESAWPTAQTIDVTAITPAQLASYIPWHLHLDLLVLDCEGAEGEILRTMDFRRTWRPRMIILESRALNPRFDAAVRAESADQLTRLADAGWQVIWQDAINAVLVRQDVLHACAIDYELAGQAHLTSGRPDAARHAFRQAVDANARNVRAWAGLAEACDALGRTAEAEAACSAALELDAQRYFHHAARVALHTSEWPKARRFVAICTMLAPHHPQTALVTARLARADGDTAAAVAALEAVLPAHPERGDLHAALADCHRAAGADHSAIAAAEEAHRIDQTPMSAHRLAQLYLAQGAGARAAALLETAVTAKPHNPHYHHALSKAYERLGDVASAQRSALAAARAARRDDGLWSRCTRLTQDPQARLEVHQEAVAACPHAPGLYLAYADALAAAGRRSAAYACLLDAVRLGCGQSGIAAALDRLGRLGAAPQRSSDSSP